MPLIRILANRTQNAKVCAAVLLPTVLLLASGCNGPATKLLGSWRVDSAEEIAERMTGESSADHLKKFAGNAAKAIAGDDFVAGRMEVEFQPGGRLVTRTTIMNQLSEKQGTWVLQKTEGDVLFVDCVLKGEKSTTEIRFINDDTIEMIPPNISVLREEFTFKRSK